MQPITAADFVSVDSKGQLVKRTGEKILLRGVNLGGWLIQESWMCPVNGRDKTWANLDSLEELRTRGFSEEQIQALFDSYQDNWLTEYDLDIMAAAGCNSLRVPFWYRNFMKNERGEWLADNPDDNPGFQRLDWVVEQAGKRGMYSILDMHGCPGGQCKAHCCGTWGRNELYTNELYRDVMKELWTAIAARYRGNPAVAAYDVMNEPNNNDDYAAYPPNNWDASDEYSWRLTNRVYREMIRAIRAVDPEHTITVEGIWDITNIPDPRVEGWENMMYQLHLYDNTEDFKRLVREAARLCADYGVAAYVGEFWNLDGIGLCEAHGVHWSLWSYKSGKPAKNSAWMHKDCEIADTTCDSYEKILRKWGAALRTENGFACNDHIIDRVRIAAGL